MFCHSLKPTGIVITTEHSWMEKCRKFGQSILSKIIKIVATSCEILRLIRTKFDFGWGSAPDPAGGELTALPQTRFKGPASKGRGSQGRGEEWEKGRGKGWIGKGECGKGEERKEERRGGERR